MSERRNVMAPIVRERKWLPPPGTSPNAILHRITFINACPICETEWRFQFRQWLEKPEEIVGAYEEDLAGEKVWRANSSKWGYHSLCGECRVNSKATLVIRRPGLNSESRAAWTDQDEAMMRGKLKHQQHRYAAMVSIAVEENPDELLLDEQATRMAEILPQGRNTIFMSKKN